MPLYEYECKQCGKHFDKLQKFADEPLTTHEECGGPVERLMSAPAFHFKGTGWYVTDYAKSNGSSPASEKKGEGKSESKGEGSKSESSKSEGGKTEGSKTESKAESKPAPSTSSKSE